MSKRITVLRGDITTVAVDVIVTAANPSLMGDGGVDGAIHRAAGPAIKEACKIIVKQEGRCVTAQAVISEAGNIPVKAIIHAIGPVWDGGDSQEADMLEQTYLNCLNLAAANGYRTIAFPAISTGAYGYPKQLAASIALATIYKYIGIRPLPEEVVFVCFDDENTQIYQQLLDKL